MTKAKRSNLRTTMLGRQAALTDRNGEPFQGSVSIGCNDSTKAQQTIKLAQAHVHKAEMLSSAKGCIADAIKCLGRGDYGSAIERAAKSLAYSVGVFSPLYTDRITKG